MSKNDKKWKNRFFMIKKWKTEKLKKHDLKLSVYVCPKTLFFSDFSQKRSKTPVLPVDTLKNAKKFTH